MLIAHHHRLFAAAKTRRTLTVEHLAYIGLAVLSIILHLWVLGGRALHHDETIHAYYSWNIAVGNGYVHDPLTHGPFLYYWTALQYLLFGDNAFTARLSAAIFGIALTLLPWLLRKQIGRGTALLTAFYLIISPVVLYVGRFIRHDIFAVTWELLCLIAILRYMRSHRPIWLYVFWGSLALMYCTIETSYLFTLTLGSFVVLVTLWQVDRRLLLPLALYAVLAVGALKLLPAHKGLLVSAENQPVLDAQGQEQWLPLPLVTESQALVVRNQGNDALLGPNGYFAVLNDTLFGDPAKLLHNVKGKTLQAQNGVFLHVPIVALTVLSLLFLAAMIWWIWLRRFTVDGTRTTLWQQALAHSPDDSFLAALNGLWSKHGALAIGVALLIYVAFFTSFGTHTSGVVSGITGSLLYWVAQHDVQRGGQPQHYYFVQLLVYEPLLLTVGLAALVGGVIHLGLQIRRGVALTAQQMAPGLLAWWAGGSLALYTWAGEKMPWITLHIAAPLTFIAAWGAARLVRWAWSWPLERSFFGMRPALAPAQARRALALYLGSMLLIAAFATIVLTRLILRTAAEPGGSANTPWLMLATLLMWAALTIGYGTFQGWRRAIGGFVIAMGLICGLYTFRSAWRLNYQNGDIPVEMMVYVQSSPDVARVMRDLERISIAEDGRMTLPIMNDNEQIWKWYTRNFERKVEFNGAMPGVPSNDIAAILMIQDNWNTNTNNVQGFVEGRFPLRWWFPEHAFYRLATETKTDANGNVVFGPDGETLTQRAPFERDSTIGRLVRRPWDAPTLNELWRYLLFRQPPAQLDAVDFKVFVRPKYAFMLGLPATTDAVDLPVR